MGAARKRRGELKAELEGLTELQGKKGERRSVQGPPHAASGGASADPQDPVCQSVRGCLTVYLLPRPYPPSGGPASPLPVLRGWISHPRPFAIHCLDRRHYCGKVFVLATVAVPMASPVTTSSTRRFCCRPSADSFEATG